MDGQLLKKYRKQRGLSQGALAEEFEVSLRTIQNWEGNKTSIPSTIYKIISDAKDISYKESTLNEPVLTYSHEEITQVEIDRFRDALRYDFEKMKSDKKWFAEFKNRFREHFLDVYKEMQ